MAPRSPIRLSRRRLLAASGATLAAGAPAALAACGTATDDDDDVSPEREAELLNEVLAQQLGVQDALGLALGANAPQELREPLGQLIDLREESGLELEKVIRELGGEPVDAGVEPIGGESPVEGVARQLETSIAASTEAIRELPADSRQSIHRAITEDAAVLAAIRSTLGEEPAPDAFVMGPPAAAEEAA